MMAAKFPPPDATREEVARFKGEKAPVVRARRPPAFCACGHARSAHKWEFPPTGESACQKCPCSSLRIRGAT